MRIRTMTLVALAVTGLAAAQVAMAGQKVRKHTVHQGDTLWDLSKSYLHDPLLWPKIWTINPDIANPHLILPGQVVRIPQPAAPPGAQAGAEPAGTTLAEPPAAPPSVADNRPPLAIKVLRDPEPEASAGGRQHASQALAALRYPQGIGLVSDRPPSSAGKVLATPDGWQQAAAGERLLVKVASASPGQRFGVYRDLGEVSNPAGWGHESPGHLWAEVGVVKMMQAAPGREQQALVVRAFSRLQSGDLLGPLPYEPRLGRITAGPAGLRARVVAVRMDRLLAGPGDVVYLDRGRRDGLAVGQRLLVVGQDDPVDSPRQGGTLVVLRVTETTAAALVTPATLHHVRPGDRVVSAL